MTEGYSSSNEVISPSDSEYYREMIDDIAPLKSLRHLNEQGQQSPIRPEQVKEINAYFWRNMQKTLYTTLGICALGLFIILLSSMSKYVGMVWDVFAGFIGIIISFVLGAIGL